MTGHYLQAVHSQTPLVHCITNYVTANDCANVLLACGASPIMADAPQEAAEIAALCDGLVLNIGTLHPEKLKAMLLAGKSANARKIPVVLDPVGAGASEFRRNAAAQLLSEVRFSAIRGNASEILALANFLCRTQSVHAERTIRMPDANKAPQLHSRGVDAADADLVTGDNFTRRAASALKLSEQTGAVIVMTGAVDVVSDAASPDQIICIRNGSPLMKRITGAGCQLSALLGAFLAAARRDSGTQHFLQKSGFAASAPKQSDTDFDECRQTNTLSDLTHNHSAAVSAVCAMGLCGELAEARMQPQDGTGSFRRYLMDAVSTLTPEMLEQGARYQSKTLP